MMTYSNNVFIHILRNYYPKEVIDGIISYEAIDKDHFWVYFYKIAGFNKYKTKSFVLISNDEYNNTLYKIRNNNIKAIIDV